MRILVAEDDPDIRKTYKAALEDRNHEVIVSEDGKQCFDIYERELLARMNYRNSNRTENTASPSSSSPPSSAYSPFDVVILDYKMPNKDGMRS